MFEVGQLVGRGCFQTKSVKMSDFQRQFGIERINMRRTDLGHGDGQEKQGTARKPEHDPEGPPPVVGLDGKS